MSDDIRVILIKISDRLHNMRTLGSQPPNKQYKIAGETLYIYAPLANRLGLNKIKEELEDLSFRYEHPEEYQQIIDKLAQTRAHRETLLEDEISECFRIYVCASRIYKPHPERLRDWLTHPKANGYQALHVTLMSKTGQWIEVQIRSTRMDEMAEQGFAAHWKYKEGSKTTADSEDELEKWLENPTGTERVDQLRHHSQGQKQDTSHPAPRRTRAAKARRRDT